MSDDSSFYPVQWSTTPFRKPLQASLLENVEHNSPCEMVTFTKMINVIANLEWQVLLNCNLIEVTDATRVRMRAGSCLKMFLEFLDEVKKFLFDRIHVYSFHKHLCQIIFRAARLIKRYNINKVKFTQFNIFSSYDT